MKILLASAFVLALQMAGCPVPDQQGGPVVDETRESRSPFAYNSYVERNGERYEIRYSIVTVHRQGQAYPDPGYREYYVNVTPENSGQRTRSVRCVPNTPAGCEETLDRHLNAPVVEDTGEEDGGYGGSY